MQCTNICLPLIYRVEIAAGNILEILQKGEIDVDALKVELDIIYEIMFPYIDNANKPTVQLVLDTIWWLIEHTFGLIYE